MWTSFVCICLAAAMVMSAAGQTIHFNMTSQDCSDNSTVVNQCTTLYQRAITDAFLTNSFTEALNCRLLIEQLACAETALCHCNFSAGHGQTQEGYRSASIITYLYNNSTNCANVTNGDSIQADVLGPIDPQAGVNCSQYNRTVGDLALAFAVAQFPQVVNVDNICPGVQACYIRYDRSVEMALYQKDWPQYCVSTEDLLDCLVSTTCSCNQTTHQLVIDMVDTERTIFQGSCTGISSLSRLLETGIRCPDYNRCEEAVPLTHCSVQLQEAFLQNSEPEGQCEALWGFANCTEQLACDCGFEQDPLYLRTLAVTNYSYNVLGNCGSLRGPFPNHTDLNCAAYGGLNDEDKIISISLALPEFVTAEELTCPGIQGCYDAANNMSTAAHRNKDLQLICQAESDLVICLEAKYCACGRLNEQEVGYRMSVLRDIHGSVCYIFNDGIIPKEKCIDCNAPNTEGTCQQEYTALITATSLADYCPSLYNFANCTENMACACKFGNEPSFYRSLAFAKHNYNVNDCEQVSGIFPNHTGLNCGSGSNLTDAERILRISLAETAFVLSEDDTCPGIRECYQISDAKSTEAHIQKDFSALCRIEMERIQCIEQKYCDCGKLFNDDVNTRMLNERVSQADLCSAVTGFIPLTRCRGQSTCTRNDPLSVCAEEYDFDSRVAGFNIIQRCQASRDYILCAEEVGCACGMLADLSSDAAISVYNLTTMSVQVYDESGCDDEIGSLPPQPKGIQCADTPDSPTSRRLVLSYANSQEVGAEADQCAAIRDCFRTADIDKGTALFNRNYVQLCRAQRTLLLCLDKAYCQCKMYGQQRVKDYMQTEIRVHDQYCDTIAPVTLNKCDNTTGAGNLPGISLLLLPVLLLLTTVMTS